MNKELKESKAGSLWKFSEEWFKHLAELVGDFNTPSDDNLQNCGWDLLENIDCDTVAKATDAFSFNAIVMYLGEMGSPAYENTDIAQYYKVMAIAKDGSAKVGWMHTVNASWLVPYE